MFDDTPQFVYQCSRCGQDTDGWADAHEERGRCAVGVTVQVVGSDAEVAICDDDTLPGEG